jgi:hypothetical protein
MAGPFDDEFTPEEEAALNDANAVPPAEEEGEGTVEEAVAAAGQGAAPAAAEPKPGEPAAAEPKPGEPAATPEAEAAAAAATATAEDEAALQEFLKKHEGKSPEELARIALQQTKRANRSEAQNRRVSEQVSALAERARVANERRNRLAGSADDLKAKFRARLQEDPDAAVADLFDGLLSSEISAADAAAQEAEQQQAIVFADAHIPEFGKQWPTMKALANEIGFTDAELDQISDGRSLVVLSLANHTARLMKAGIMDNRGNIVAVPQVEAQPLDPRLAAPAPQKTLGGAGTGARGARGNQSVEAQLQEISQMTDEEFNKLDPTVLDQLLRAA